MAKSIQFHPYNSHVETRIYRRNLPHWRQSGCTYFVTFRLGDSIPLAILQTWAEERRSWCAAHEISIKQTADEWKSRYKLIPEFERRAFERQQARRLHLELDRCHGSCLLRVAANRALVESALRFFDGKRCGCGDFVVMPNHVHWLVQPYKGYELENLLQSIKRYASSRTARKEREPGKLWQKENYDHIIRDCRELNAFRQYISENPKKARLSAEEYSLYQVDWVKM